MSNTLEYYSDDEDTVDTSNYSQSELNKSKAVEPAKVLRLFPDRLTNYEKDEILKYDKIYFIGGDYHTKPVPTLFNHGFDDHYGAYQFEIHDHIAYRYEIIKMVGSGSFGSVLSVYDHKRKVKVALKIILNRDRFHAMAKTEIEILRLLKSADKNDKFNFVKMKSYFTFRNHVCITFELLYINLLHYLRGTNHIGCSQVLVRRFTYSIVKSLCVLNKMRIVHCDLVSFQPENIMLRAKNKSGIKLIDFGSSCFENQTHYPYIQTRYYRAPEVILQLKYGLPIDMWSLGCVISELSTGRVLFKGDDRCHQLACIVEYSGDLPEKLCNNKFYKEKFLASGYAVTKTDHEKISSTNIQAKNWRTLSGSKSFLFNKLKKSRELTDFVEKCLKVDQDDRMSPIEALEHQFLNLRNEKFNYVLNQIELLPKSYLKKNCEASQWMKKLSIRD